MTPSEYLSAILDTQTLGTDSPELTALQEHRAEIETLLREHYTTPTIRYGGSKGKGTMIKASYDLDLICYFPADDNSAGTTLKDIYYEVRDVLAEDYTIEEKPSALRLRGCDASKPDFHVDVVPGRYTDATKTDTFLFQSSGEKQRLKTNLQVHIDHVRESGVRDAIRLAKLWKVRNAISVRNFVLELLTIKLLAKKKSSALPDQLQHLWAELRDNIDDMTVEDPANPQGNDLSAVFDSFTKSQLKIVASNTLSTLATGGWVAIFGALPKDESAVTNALRQAPTAVSNAPAPWTRCP
jgi:hypothetical protein